MVRGCIEELRILIDRNIVKLVWVMNDRAMKNQTYFVDEIREPYINHSAPKSRVRSFIKHWKTQPLLGQCLKTNPWENHIRPCSKKTGELFSMNSYQLITITGLMIGHDTVSVITCGGWVTPMVLSSYPLQREDSDSLMIWRSFRT